MPFVEGESLRDRLAKEGRLPLEEAVRIAREVADGLAYAHERGVVHRDIKPENILLSAGHVVIADFGIARAVDAAGGTAITHTGMVMGTPAYMSPEQSLGERTVDQRSDIYSLACVLYEMLASEPPFAAPTAQAMLAQRLSRPAPRITAVMPAVPASLDDVLARALATDAADRYSAAAEFGDALVDAIGAGVRPGRSAPGTPSVAVLPFSSMSADPENEYFSEGITEEIINVLARIGGLRVAARSSSFAFKDKGLDIPTLARKLGVATVLEGSVRRAGNRVRITAQLVNASDGYHLWSEKYDRDLDDIFAVQDEIAGAIAGHLRVALSKSEGPGRGTRDLEAYDLYLKGNYFWRRQPHKGIGYFSQALARDPAFPHPYAGLAQAYCVLGVYQYLPAPEAHARANEAAERALALDDTIAESHYAVGLTEAYYGWNVGRARRELLRAYELDPNTALPCAWLAQLAGALGRVEEARQWLAKAIELEPFSQLVTTVGGLALLWCGDLEGALRCAQVAVEVEPGLAGGHWLLGWVHESAGRIEKAVEAYQTAVRGPQPSPHLLCFLASAYAQVGRTAEAWDALRQAESLGAEPGSRSVAYWVLGDTDRASALMEEGFQRRNVFWGYLGFLQGQSAIARSLADPRFRALVKKYGVERPAGGGA
ncbi:MAG: protein kinase [Gemmatimonadetes bacterium]|nr:protein kinase [Gemmatimonadota bacterium]